MIVLPYLIPYSYEKATAYPPARLVHRFIEAAYSLAGEAIRRLHLNVS